MPLFFIIAYPPLKEDTLKVLPMLLPMLLNKYTQLSFHILNLPKNRISISFQQRLSLRVFHRLLLIYHIFYISRQASRLSSCSIFFQLDCVDLRAKISLKVSPFLKNLDSLAKI